MTNTTTVVIAVIAFTPGVAYFLAYCIARGYSRGKITEATRFARNNRGGAHGPK